MFKRTQGQKRIAVLMIVLVSTLVAACGDEGGSKDTSASGTSSASSGGILLCVAFILTSGNDECASYSYSSSSQSGIGKAILYSFSIEFEPNDDTLNANPLNLAATQDLDGFIVEGSVSDVSDQHDTFAFALSGWHDFEFRLCSHGQQTCDGSGEIDSPTAYIDILDAQGKRISTTAGNSRNYKQIRLDGGVSYYVRVVAADTMAATVMYNLTGRELN
jgi:predicted small secreted protein